MKDTVSEDVVCVWGQHCWQKRLPLPPADAGGVGRPCQASKAGRTCAVATLVPTHGLGVVQRVLLLAVRAVVLHGRPDTANRCTQQHGNGAAAAPTQAAFQLRCRDTAARARLVIRVFRTGIYVAKPGLQVRREEEGGWDCSEWHRTRRLLGWRQQWRVRQTQCLQMHWIMFWALCLAGKKMPGSAYQCNTRPHRDLGGGGRGKGCTRG